MGIPCTQHRPIRMVEVLNHYDIPCTVAADKQGLLQAMVMLQTTITDAEVNIIKDWLLTSEESFTDTMRAKHNPANDSDSDSVIIVGEHSVKRPNDSDSDSVIIVGERSVKRPNDSDSDSVIIVGERSVKRPIIEGNTSVCAICMESFPSGSFITENLTPWCGDRKQDHIFCITCLQDHIVLQVTDPERRVVTCPICLAELPLNTIREFSSRETFDR